MPKLKIMAIGGGGISALNNLSLTKWDPVTCVAADTDPISLGQSSAQIKIQLGKKITGGCSSCCNPKMGGLAAIDSREEIRAILAGAEMVLILSCLGGGTGTGVAPVV
ncbi:MAG: cell division protein FtsZ, partial [Syntrophales bacterium LBB04]|nr:cell division protein FtsZ [Syntrophales bacterium LBB04]